MASWFFDVTVKLARKAPCAARARRDVCSSCRPKPLPLCSGDTPNWVMCPVRSETRLARQELAKIKAELQAMADVKALELSKDSLFTRSERLNKQIEGVNKAMDAAIALGDAKAIQAHAMSLEKLYNLWSLLTGHEKPGVRKSSTKSKTRPQYQNLPEPDTE